MIGRNWGEWRIKEFNDCQYRHCLEGTTSLLDIKIARKLDPSSRAGRANNAEKTGRRLIDSTRGEINYPLLGNVYPERNMKPRKRIESIRTVADGKNMRLVAS